MSRSSLTTLGIAGILGAFTACSAVSERGSSFDDDAAGAGGAGGATTGGAGGTSSSGGLGFDPGAGEGGPPGAGVCTTDATTDDDGDGFVEPADCNDCDANVNPAAIEVLAQDSDGSGGSGSGGGGGAGGGGPVAADEDCDGAVDNVAAACDDGLVLDDADPMNAARAIDLCRQASGPGDWGVLSAQYVRASGAPVTGPSMQHGIFQSFGPNVTPRGGQRMLALSTGRARIPGQPGACGALTCTGLGAGQAPPGFPQDVPNCPGDTDINDDIALEVHLRAPSNATGYQFNFRFYSFEYPEWVCSAFNDQFIALVSPPPQGSVNGNLSFDSQHNPVSVNVAFFEVCQGCLLGTSELQGTGFDSWNDAGGTGWLTTTAPVTGGEEISVRFAIWDTGDQAWDSTAVIDNFKWIANGGTVVVATEPAPEVE